MTDVKAQQVAQVCQTYRNQLEEIAYIADHEDVFGTEDKTDVQQAIHAILDALNSDKVAI